MEESSGRCSLNALLAWVTSAFLSAKNRIRFAQLVLESMSTIAAAVLVLPLPVAMTKSASLCVPLNCPFSVVQ